MANRSRAGADARTVALRRLTSAFAFAVVAQAAVFLAFAAALQFGANAIFESAAGSGAAPAVGLVVTVSIVLLILELFFALFLSFVVSRRLLFAIVRATPHPNQPPTRPVPFAALCAALIVSVVSIVMFAASLNAVASGGLAWLIELLRVAAVIAAFWVGGSRAVFGVRTT